jgi:NADH:ubiquinone reductase (H+-translocating)
MRMFRDPDTGTSRPDGHARDEDASAGAATARHASPKVVIAGAGFGGLDAARALRHAPVDITILDRHNYHCFQPLLYQVATATLSPADIAWPIRALFRTQTNATVLLAEVTGVDAKRGLVFAGCDVFPFDFLILATGATHSYFGHDDWAAVALGLKTIEDATAIRRKTLLAFEKAELARDEKERKALMTFIIVGGGPTGVEMAGAIATIAQESLQPDFRRIDASEAHVILLEAGPRILPVLPPDLGDYAKRALERMGVEVRTSTPVTKCDGCGVDTANGRIDAATIIWAAGVVASPAAKWLGVKPDRAGRVEVGADLTVPGYPNIYVIGDTAAARRETGELVPGIAPAAKQMGQYAGRRIAAALAGKKIAPFHYRHEGDLATIGRKAAVVKLDHFTLKGFAGWAFWGVAHIYFLIGIRKRFAVAFSWLWDWATYSSSARLITGNDHEAQAPQAAADFGSSTPPHLLPLGEGTLPPHSPLAEEGGDRLCWSPGEGGVRR